MNITGMNESQLRKIVSDAAHEAAAKVNLSEQLDNIRRQQEELSCRIYDLDRRLREHYETETIEMRKAVSDGIVEGLKRVALDDQKAGDDIKELRSLLAAWNDVKAAVWAKVKHIIAVAILASIAWLVSVFTNIPTPWK